jgi:pyruvate,water dikinase
MIRNSLRAPRAEHAPRTRADAEAEVRTSLDRHPLERQLGLRRRLMLFAASRARYFLKLRENSRFYHIMGFYTLRRKILHAEAELLRAGKLKCRDDIFFLRWDEIASLRDGGVAWRDVESRIRERRIEFVRLSKLTPPRTIGIDTASDAPVAARGTRDRLTGQSAAPGRHEGIARVILDPSVDLALAPGEVLVAPYTDPAWTPLFLTAGAAVVEIGSALSHAGTVAREFGMPCVVDVADCTTRIQSGDRVLVDADRGTVDILERTLG